jgi:metal-sulfur cluster biosynthetic enzyme
MENRSEMLDSNPHPQPPTETSVDAVSTSDVETLVWDQLRDCYDPEIPLNIVDLGLVYEVGVQAGQANIKMTLTSPGCHLGGQIAGTVQEKLLALDQIEEANIELVWDPPWHQSMISAQGRKILGLDPP